MQFINYALFVVIIISAVAYFYNKTKQFRSKLPIRAKWYKAKAGVTLGIFITAFGLNTPIISPDVVGFIIGGIFLIIGISLIFNQSKRANHEGKFVVEEYDLNK